MRLAALADDEQPFVRWNVALTLGLLGDEAALPALERLAKDEHANTRLRVAFALALLGDRGGIPVLEVLARDPYAIGDQYPVRVFAALALGALADSVGTQALVELAGDEDPAVRWHATVALGDVGDPAGVESLVERSADPIPFVRAHAAIALAEIGVPEGADAVRRLTADKVDRVAKISSQALALLEASPPGSSPPARRAPERASHRPRVSKKFRNHCSTASFPSIVPLTGVLSGDDQDGVVGPSVEERREVAAIQRLEGGTRLPPREDRRSAYLSDLDMTDSDRRARLPHGHHTPRGTAC